MRTPKEFEYDLWTTNENDTKRYWVRIKHTGEVTEVDHTVMCVLRAAEKELRREMEDDENGEKPKKPLSLDYIVQDETSEEWMADDYDFVEEIIANEMEAVFLKHLTDKQRSLYLNCMKAGVSLLKYSKDTGMNYDGLKEMKEAIRKKYKKLFP